MKGSSSIEKIIAGHFIWLLVTLPLDKFYGELGLISLCIISLANIRHMRWSGAGWSTAALLTLPFFISLIWSFEGNARHEAWSLVGKQLGILLLPAMAWGWREILTRFRAPILRWFTHANALLILWLYAMAVMDLRYAGLPLTAIRSDGFTHHHFLQPLNQHASFISLFWTMALLALLSEQQLFKSPIRIVLSIILLAGLIQLQSVALLPVALVFLFIRFMQPWRSWKLVLIASTISIGGFFLYTSIYPHLHEELSRHAGVHPEDSRLDRWSAGWELVRARPWTGYGTGEEKQALQPVFFEKGLYSSYVNRLNVHNQFLAYLIRAGIPGLLFFLSMLISLARQAIKSRNGLLAGFLACFVALCMAEDVLDVQKGVFFLAVMGSFTALVGQPAAVRLRIHKRAPGNSHPVPTSNLVYEPS